MYILGFDIGGTKCAVITARWDGKEITLLKKEKCPTDHSLSPGEMIQKLILMADSILDAKPEAIGISCGGPLDTEKGIIMGPPNLPGWDHVPITELIGSHYNVTPKLQNDANACAVAEWKFGAGKGCRNMVFLTFGTGLGAGLILNGQLYDGTNGNAGEVGHIRLADSGPVGYGKAGSFEGFCSGGGLAQLGYSITMEKLRSGIVPAYYTQGMRKEDITAKVLSDAANQGDETALEVYRICGTHLGMGLSILIDILNPQRIVIGSIFSRSGNLLWDSAKQVIDREALPGAARVCEVVSAALAEHIGDYAAVATALL